MVKIIIRGTLPGLNEMIEAYKHGACEGTRLKRRSENGVMHAARRLGKWRAEKPVYMIYHWYEPNKNRDKDNVTGYGRKVIQDALVKAKIIRDDGWNDIVGYDDKFGIDSKNPRIVVEIFEVE